MHKSLTPALCAVLCAVATTPAAGRDCRFFADREARIELAGAASVSIFAGAGSLRVVGVSGLDEVRAEGEGCATREELMREVRIDVSREGDEIVVRTLLPRTDSDWSSLDLEVEVPDSLPVSVTDSSGGLDVRDVASLALRDSSGNIEVDNVRGDLSIEDSSGEIEVSGVTGNVTLQDSSGNIEVRRVEGSVTVTDDSSGNIEVEQVQGNVLVLRDSSGSIRVRDVAGDFTVESDSSGAITHARVAGNVVIPEHKRDD